MSDANPDMLALAQRRYVYRLPTSTLLPSLPENVSLNQFHSLLAPLHLLYRCVIVHVVFLEKRAPLYPTGPPPNVL